MTAWALTVGCEHHEVLLPQRFGKSSCPPWAVCPCRDGLDRTQSWGSQAGVVGWAEGCQKFFVIPKVCVHGSCPPEPPAAPNSPQLLLAKQQQRSWRGEDGQSRTVSGQSRMLYSLFVLYLHRKGIAHSLLLLWVRKKSLFFCRYKIVPWLC